ERRDRIKELNDELDKMSEKTEGMELVISENEDLKKKVTLLDSDLGEKTKTLDELTAKTSQLETDYEKLSELMTKLKEIVSQFEG
ncbi:MAG TPA: hypothetical protein VLJ60_02740, partial [bacterium]|nr:hypothetical protein [bacterium]